MTEIVLPSGMHCTFWHCGVLIGEADLESNPERRQQIAGVFRPTAYGLQIFPRLTGILSAGHALKSHLDANGLDPDNMAGDQIEELLDGTPAGRKIIDIGRTLSEVELRGPDDTRLEFASIGFTDIVELQALARELNTDSADELTTLPPEAPRYLVSTTLRDPERARTSRIRTRLRARRPRG
jgi:hypothetical protein